MIDFTPHERARILAWLRETTVTVSERTPNGAYAVQRHRGDRCVDPSVVGPVARDSTLVEQAADDMRALVRSFERELVEPAPQSWGRAPGATDLEPPEEGS